MHLMTIKKENFFVKSKGVECKCSSSKIKMNVITLYHFIFIKNNCKGIVKSAFGHSLNILK